MNEQVIPIPEFAEQAETTSAEIRDIMSKLDPPWVGDVVTQELAPLLLGALHFRQKMSQIEE